MCLGDLRSVEVCCALLLSAFHSILPPPPRPTPSSPPQTCQNYQHVLMLGPKGMTDRIFTCGSNAFRPWCYYRHVGLGLGLACCLPVKFSPSFPPPPPPA